MDETASQRRFHPWLYLALIVPAAHTRVFDEQFQLEAYEVFHTRPAARWGHLLCTPLINVGLLALASQLDLLSFHPMLDASLVAALLTLGCYVTVHGALGLLMVPLLAIAVLAARGLVHALGEHALAGTLVIVAAATAIQTWSHALEPVTPPWSGSHRWTSMPEFLRWSSFLKVAGFTLMALVFFPLLELWAAPRVWPLQMIHLLMRAGLLRERAGVLRARVDAVLRNGWGGEEA